MISVVVSILLSLQVGSHENILLTSTRSDTLWITTQTEGSVRTAHMDFMLPQSWSPITVTRTDTGRVARVLVRVSNHRDFDSSVIVVVYPIVSGVTLEYVSGVGGSTAAPLFDLLGRRVYRKWARQFYFTYL